MVQDIRCWFGSARIRKSHPARAGRGIRSAYKSRHARWDPAYA